MKKARPWKVFGVVAAIVFAADLAFIRWREYTLEPLTSTIDLSRPGKYSWHVRGLHASRYHPEFRLHLRDPLPWDWNWGPQYERLWGAAAPEVVIDIRSSGGQLVLHEQSALTPDAGWIITGAVGASVPESVVEVYKFVEFTPRMMGSCDVTLQVLRSPRRLPGHVDFEIAAIKSYVMLGPVFGLFGLIVLFIIAIAVMAVVTAKSDP